MADDLTGLFGTARSFELGGVTYKVTKLKLKDIAEINQWLKEQIPDPRIAARKYMEGLPEAVACHVWDQACREPWPTKLGSPEAGEAMQTYEGIALLLHLVLRRCQPSLTRDQAGDLAQLMTPDKFGDLITLISPGEPGDPKFPTLATVPA